MIRVRLVIAAALVLVLMAGCEDGGVGVEPKNTVKVGAADLKSTRTEILDLIDAAVKTASSTAGGQKVATNDEIKSSICDALYPRRFNVVQASGSFVVPGADRASVVGNVRDAWLAEGWKPEVGGKEVAGEDDLVKVTQKTSSGVPLTIRAVVLEGTSGQAVVNINVRTSCIEMSQDALDSLDEWQDDMR